MNTKIISIALLCIISFSPVAFSQKYDNIWLMGYDATYAPDDSFCVSVFDFSNGSLEVGVNQDIEAFLQETNVSLCDADGNLQMYSNGVHIFNKNHEIMENGAWLIPNVPLESFNIPQGTLAFYLPGDNQRIILIHPKKDYVEAPLWTTTITRLYYSIIDMSINNGLGKVIQKNIPFLTDTLDYGKLTAVRHGNGQDWWILANEANSNRFYKILLNENGLGIYNNQAIGNNIPLSLGQAAFSPDGKIFATVGGVDDILGNFLSVYNFDRCTGELSNPQQLNWYDEISGSAIGMAIAPNSQFLYVPSSRYLYQYDLLSSSLEASRQIVAVYDGFQSPFGSKFYLAQLALDNKIYINCSNGETVMHVIHNPNEPGLACNIEQHGIQLPCYNAYSIPNFPNYRLGDWPGSPCDTLGINPSTEAIGATEGVGIYPNPATTTVQIVFKTPLYKERSVIVYDLAGREVLSEPIADGSSMHTLLLSDFLDGWYFVCIAEKGRVVHREKLAVIRH